MNEASEATLKLFQNVFDRDPENEILQSIFKIHEKYTPEEVLLELLKDGSNTLATFLRRRPVEYDEVLRDVADKLDVKYDDNSDYENIEMSVVAKVIEELKKQSDDNSGNIVVLDENGEEKSLDPWKGEFAKYINDKIKSSNKKLTADILSDILINIALKAAMKECAEQVVKQTATKVAGVIAAQQAAKQVSKQIARQIAKEGTKRVSASYIGALVPAVNVLMAAWIVVDIAGPAYRKTIPSIIQTSILRIHERCVSGMC